MDDGILALAGIAALVVICVVWNALHARGIASRLAALGFEPCDRDAPALERAFQTLAGTAVGGRTRAFQLSGCLRRAAGLGFLHRFHVSEELDDRSPSDEPRVGAHYDAYLLDLRDGGLPSRGPITIFVLPKGNGLMRRIVRGVIDLGAPGARLEITPRPLTEAIVAAYGPAEGKLDEAVPQALQEKVARAAEHGILAIHLGGGSAAAGKAAFTVPPGNRDVDREIAYLAEWC